MTRCLAIVLFAAALSAQNGADPFNRPPAAVDKALRDRVAEFFQDHVTGHFRQAEELVAEDTKDFFYNGNKPSYISFEISRIEYSENFTRAKATVLCEQNVVMPGFGGKSSKSPRQAPGSWRTGSGTGTWIRARCATRHSDALMPRLRRMERRPRRPCLPGPRMTTPDIALNRIQVDKNSLTLKAGESGQITLSNTAPGPMTITFAKTQGFEVRPAAWR